MDSPWKFELLQSVKISVSGEVGTVIGRAEYSHDERRYQLRYKSADGVGSESWWNESALEAARS